MERKVFDLALICAYHEERMASSWVRASEEIGKKCLIITPNFNEFLALQEQKIAVVYLGNLAPSSTPTIEEIKKYFNNLGVDDLDNFIGTERSYYRQSENPIIRSAFRYAKSFTKLFEEYDIRCILHPVQGGEVVRSTASLLAHAKGIRVVYVGETFIPRTMNLYSDEMRTVIKINRETNLTETEAEAIIRDKVERKPVVFYETTLDDYVTTPLVKKFMRLVRAGNWNIIHAYFAYKKIIHVDRHVKDFYTKITGVFEDPDASDKYFYYPFNVDAESELFIRNKDFTDQASTIEKLSVNLPDGYKLYVKTHPGVEGHLTLNNYRRLKKLKNVKILHASVNSFNVVKNSLGVIIVSSTVGLESYILGKPTCIIGHWPYDIYGNFIICKDLSLVFDKLLGHKGTPNDPVKFVQNIYRDTIDGSIYASKQDFKNLVKSLFNVLSKAF